MVCTTTFESQLFCYINFVVISTQPKTERPEGGLVIYICTVIKPDKLWLPSEIFESGLYLSNHSCEA
jgi:hypothetical protein